MNPTPLIVTIDGTAASGKSSVARLTALQLHFLWLSSGRLFRLVGLMASEQGWLPRQTDHTVKTDNRQFLEKCVEDLKSSLVIQKKGDVFTINNRDITQDLLSEKAGVCASQIAQDPLCRELLLHWQRDLAQSLTHRSPDFHGVIFEGRDMGTVVFPFAPLKFFLTCKLHLRAQRRWQELHPNQTPTSQDLAELQSLLRQRDHKDTHRKIAPLKPADDAMIIDTTFEKLDNTVGQVSEKILNYLNAQTKT